MLESMSDYSCTSSLSTSLSGIVSTGSSAFGIGNSLFIGSVGDLFIMYVCCILMSDVLTGESIMLLYTISLLLSTCGSSLERLTKWQFDSPVFSIELHQQSTSISSLSWTICVPLTGFQINFHCGSSTGRFPLLCGRSWYPWAWPVYMGWGVTWGFACWDCS